MARSKCWKAAARTWWPKQACTATATTPRERNSDTPLDEHNHALAALRYLISRLDERKMARSAAERGAASERAPAASAAAPRERTLTEVVEDERVWQ
jgi:hypothetical protein